jgi:hypothetical protein
MASADTVKKAIAPGSTESGDRQKLEAGIESIMGGGGEPMPPVTPAISPQDPFGDPESALAGAEGFSSDLPITAGLSVGPGAGPTQSFENLPIPTMQVLQDMALNAKTPQVRQMALLALRRIVREGQAS